MCVNRGVEASDPIPLGFWFKMKLISPGLLVMFLIWLIYLKLIYLQKNNIPQKKPWGKYIFFLNPPRATDNSPDRELRFFNVIPQWYWVRCHPPLILFSPGTQNQTQRYIKLIDTEYSVQLYKEAFLAFKFLFYMYTNKICAGINLIS